MRISNYNAPSGEDSTKHNVHIESSEVFDSEVVIYIANKNAENVKICVPVEKPGATKYIEISLKELIEKHK